MPTSKPRISITLEASDLAVLDRYALAAGSPRATILAGLISSAVPELARASELIELANNAPRRVREGIVQELSNATADALGFLEPFSRDYHQAMNALQYELSLDKPRRREGPTVVLRSGAPGGPARRPKLPKNPRPLTGGSK